MGVKSGATAPLFTPIAIFEAAMPPSLLVGLDKMLFTEKPWINKIGFASRLPIWDNALCAGRRYV